MKIFKSGIHPTKKLEVMTHISCSQGDTDGWAGSQRQKHVNVFAIIGFSQRACGLMGNKPALGWVVCPVIWPWSEKNIEQIAQSWRMRFSLESLVLSWVLRIWLVGYDSKLYHDKNKQASKQKKQKNWHRHNLHWLVNDSPVLWAIRNNTSRNSLLLLLFFFT